jgi:hypothetical protein
MYQDGFRKSQILNQTIINQLKQNMTNADASENSNQTMLDATVADLVLP